jgi:hypothetical protein
MVAAPPPTPVQVVREWSADLNANRNAAAAALFARGARVVQFGVDARLTTPKLAEEFNAALPCAGFIERVQVNGDSVVAVFRLGQRPHHRCDGPGQEAAALFVVQGGKIVLWEQVAVPPPKKKASSPPA